MASPETTLPSPPGDRCLVSLIRRPGWAVQTMPTLQFCVLLTPVAPLQPGDGLEANSNLSSHYKKAGLKRRLDSIPHPMPDSARPLVVGKRDLKCAGQRHCRHLITVPGLFQPTSFVPTACFRDPAQLVSCIPQATSRKTRSGPPSCDPSSCPVTHLLPPSWVGTESGIKISLKCPWRCW